MKVAPAILILVAGLCFNAACSEEKGIETSPQAAIGSFTLGYYDVLTNEINYLGHDTVIRVREHGVMYPMTIDDLNSHIFNTDSLAYGSDVSSVTCDIMAKGTVVYEYMDEPGTGYIYSAKTPIDFSRPLEFTVVSSDGSYLRRYRFELNIHQVFPDSLRWERTDAPALASPQLAVMADIIYLLGINDTGAMSVATCQSNNGQWTDAVPATGLTGQPKSVMALGRTLFANCGESIFSSTDGHTWVKVRDGVKTLYAPARELQSTASQIWMLGTDGKLYHSTDMQRWTQNQELPKLFPDSAVSAVYSTLRTNHDIQRAIIAGPVQKDGHTLLWNKLSTDTVWTEISVPENGGYNLPAMDNLKIIEYDGSLFAIGNNLNGFYQSNDNGITWYYCERHSYEWSTYNRFMQTPDELKGLSQPFACVTDNNGGIWIVTSDGQSWYGSIVRLRKANN